MAINVLKEKKALTSKTKEKQQHPLEKLVDEFGALAEERAILEELPAFKNYDAKKKELLDELDSNFQPEEKGDVKGKSHGVGFTAKRSSSKVVSMEDKKKIRAILGDDVFLAVIDFSITKLKDYLSGPDFKKYVTTVQEGARTVKPYKL